MSHEFPHDFLRQSPVFGGLPPELLAMVYQAGEMLECGPGHVLFEEGSPGFDLFVVKEGVVEVVKAGESAGVSKVVSFLTEGDTVGEMSLLTGQLRSATVRVPEHARIFRMPGHTFDGLARSHAEISLNLAKALAHRLQAVTSLHIAESGAAKHLAGDLAYFDLLEVCQALNQGRRTGLLRIRTEQADGVWLYFRQGELLHARLGPLVGSDAALAIFRATLSGSFEFEAQDAADELAGEEPITDGALGLFLEAARQKDEIQEILSRLPGPDHVFSQLTPFPWRGVVAGAEDDLTRWQPADEAALQLAARVWAGVAVGDTVNRIQRDNVVHELTALKVLRSLARLQAVV